jgi:UDP-N-acetylglucosamine--N-acetylmuramyl-(pentapeptide) pyrophosphoryl-undecaprenol N-acetylglucosamine transferase
MTGPIMIAAGGTGGHFFPAEALAAELQRRGRTVALMTDVRSGGDRSAVFANTERFVLSGGGIAGHGMAKIAKSTASLAAGTLQALGILRRLRPSAIVGFGGYPTVAPVLASRALRHRPRVVLHEQNAVLGRANRAMSRLSDKLALSFAGTTKIPASADSEVTGNPVRAAIIAKAGAPYQPATDHFNLLVLGGSLGASVFSNVVPDAISLLPDSAIARLRVTQQCRKEDLEKVSKAYAALGIEAQLSSFFPDVANEIARAHIVIARAGASTVAELAAIGRPSILVPLPSAIDDHQRANARAIADAGGAWMMHQSIFTAADLADFLAPLIEAPESLAKVAEAAAGFSRIDATTRLADLVEQTINSAENAA